MLVFGDTFDNPSASFFWGGGRGRRAFTDTAVKKEEIVSARKNLE